MLRRKPGLREKLYGHAYQLTNEDLKKEIKELNKVEKKPKKKKRK